MLVPEFEKVVRKLEQQVTLLGQSKSTLNNYIRRIALFVIHFGKLPEQIDPEEINEYLVGLARDPKSPSRSSFKHMVYGLRYYYRLMRLNKNAIAQERFKTACNIKSTGVKRTVCGSKPFKTTHRAYTDLFSRTSRAGGDQSENFGY